MTIDHVFDDLATLSADEIAEKLRAMGIRDDRTVDMRCETCPLAAFASRLLGKPVWVGVLFYHFQSEGNDDGSDYPVPESCQKFMRKADRHFYPFLDSEAA